MKVKLLVGKLLSIVEKGTISFSTGIDEKDKMSDWGKFAVLSGKIGAKSVSREASSYCLRKLDQDEVVEKEGCFAVPIPKLKAVLESLPSDSFVEIEFVENKTDDSIGILVFSSGKNLWKIPCNNPKIIPDVKIDDGDSCLIIEKDDLLKAISSVIFAVNKNDANFTKSNICLYMNGDEVLFGATDNIRCAVYRSKGLKPLLNRKVLIPSNSISKILKSFDNGMISICSGSGFVRFSQEGHSAKLSLHAEADVDSFPNFEEFVNTDYPVNSRVMTSKFKNIIQSCYKMNGEECLMKICDNEINLFAYDSKDGTSYKSSISSTGDSVKLSMGICSVYLLEFLKKVDEEVVQISFPKSLVAGKAPFIMVFDGECFYYMMSSLMDLVHVPPESK